MNEAGIHVEAATVAYDGSVVLDTVTLQLDPHESLAVIGASGSGKSTLLRLIAGLEPPDEGRIAISGRSVSEAHRILVEPRHRSIGMVFQDLALWPMLSALDNVALGLSGWRSDRAAARARALRALGLCGAAPLAKRMPGELSGGQQQRVALARAIAAGPRWLLLDEPFGGLDIVTREALCADISAGLERRDHGLILVTHDPFEAARLCRKVVVLDAGRVVEAGEMQALLEAPASAMLQAFARILRRTDPERCR